MKNRWRRPSGGLIFLGGSWVLLGTFLAWGFTQPGLERVHSVILRTSDPDAEPLNDSELELLRSSMQRHPGLAVALGGRDRLGWVEEFGSEWCTLPRAHYVLHGNPDAPSTFWIESRAHERAYPLVVSLEAKGVHREVRFVRDGRQSLTLAAGELTKPVIVQVSVNAAIPSGPDAHPFRIAITPEPPPVVQQGSP